MLIARLVLQRYNVISLLSPRYLDGGPHRHAAMPQPLLPVRKSGPDNLYFIKAQQDQQDRNAQPVLQTCGGRWR